jgi:hypothetical protein
MIIIVLVFLTKYVVITGIYNCLLLPILYSLYLQQVGPDSFLPDRMTHTFVPEGHM